MSWHPLVDTRPFAFCRFRSSTSLSRWKVPSLLSAPERLSKDPASGNKEKMCHTGCEALTNFGRNSGLGGLGRMC